MPLAPPFNRIRFLYHFTDQRNLASIQQSRALYSTAKLHEKGMTAFHPGGNDVSLEADRRFGMDRFVHLCFNTNHPLEYLARTDGRIQRTTWLYIKPEVLELEGALFCPGVANRADMEPVPLSKAADLIDLDILYKWNDWNDSEVYARRQAAERCEILIPNKIPFRFFGEHFPNG